MLLVPNIVGIMCLAIFIQKIVGRRFLHFVPLIVLVVFSESDRILMIGYFYFCIMVY